MTAVTSVEGGGPSHEKGARRRWAAYCRANWLLSGAGVTLTLAGVPASSPEVQAIRSALRAVNLAGGLEKEGKEATPGQKEDGPKFGSRAG